MDRTVESAFSIDGHASAPRSEVGMIVRAEKQIKYTILF